MSKLFDFSSLAMIPSAYKDGKLYSIRPTDGSGDFTFSRGSNLAATRVDVNGLIEKGRENLLTQSNNFSTSPWAGSGISLSSGFEGYDGKNNAWELTRSASAYSRLNYSITQSGVVRHSVYAKAGTLNWISVGPSGGSEGTWFDLTTGEQGEEGYLIIDSSIQSVGNGWWRISVLVNNPVNQFFRLYPANVDGGDDSTTAGTIYIQDAQLEQGLVATDYIETGASTAQSGILEDMPRLDYSGGASCPSLLLEPSRTNAQPHSEYFGSFTNTEQTTLTPNATTSPEGVVNAYEVTPQATTNYHRIVADAFTTTSGVDTTISMYVKPNGYNYLLLRTSTGTNDNVAFDFTDGSITYEESGYTAFVEDAGNGWYRIGYTKNFSLTSPNVYIRFQPTATTNSSISQFTGDGTSGGYIYGFQAELGSYPTSYIPTYGTSQTRSGEATLTDANTFDSLSSFTWFFEISRLGFSNDSAGSALSLRDSSGAEQIRCHFDSPSEQIRFRDALNGYATMRSISVSADTIYKMCLVCDGVTTKLFLDGSLSGGEYTIVSQFDVDRIYMNGSGFICNQLVLFPTALTDSECIALTTL